MNRKKPAERVGKLRDRDTDAFLELRRKAKRWADDNFAKLQNARPLIPEGLNDRAADNWEPLLAIADLAGNEWPMLARNAAVKLSADFEAEAQADSNKVRLLDKDSRPLRYLIFRGSIPHPMQSLCTLRNHCCQRPRNTRYQADATPYLGRTFTGWIAPALCWRTHSITSSARASSIGGKSRPSVFAVLRLMTNSNRVGC